MRSTYQGVIMENEEVSLWNKKQTEVTVGDSLKIAGLVTVATVVVPLVVLAAINASGGLVQKFKSRKAAKLAVVPHSN
jgi:hypothetical protein